MPSRRGVPHWCFPLCLPLPFRTLDFPVFPFVMISKCPASLPPPSNLTSLSCRPKDPIRSTSCLQRARFPSSEVYQYFLCVLLRRVRLLRRSLIVVSLPFHSSPSLPPFRLLAASCAPPTPTFTSLSHSCVKRGVFCAERGERFVTSCVPPPCTLHIKRSDVPRSHKPAHHCRVFLSRVLSLSLSFPLALPCPLPSPLRLSHALAWQAFSYAPLTLFPLFPHN